MLDLRNVENGDPSPDGKGTLAIRRGIEKTREGEPVLLEFITSLEKEQSRMTPRG